MHSSSVISKNNIGSQTLTDQVLTTIIRKQTESGSSEVYPAYNQQHMNTEEVASNNGNSTLSHFNYFMTKKHNLSKHRLKSLNNTEGESKMKSSYSVADNIGYIDTLKDERFNRRVRLNEEDEKYSSEHSSDNNNGNMEDSIRHLSRIRSRDFSNSTNKSHNQLGKRSGSNSGLMFSGMPSNAVIQETLRKQYYNTKVSRKDYSKRTRVSVLDSSLSSLVKNSAHGDANDLQNRDPNSKLKSVSSGGSNNTAHHYTKTNPNFHFNKFKDISHGYRQTNLAKSSQFIEFNSPSFVKNSSLDTPQTLSRDYGRDLSNNRRFNLILHYSNYVRYKPQ
jgi:hypothetical protein